MLKDGALTGARWHVQARTMHTKNATRALWTTAAPRRASPRRTSSRSARTDARRPPPAPRGAGLVNLAQWRPPRAARRRRRPRRARTGGAARAPARGTEKLVYDHRPPTPTEKQRRRPVVRAPPPRARRPRHL